VGRGWALRKKGKKQKSFLVLSPRPGPDGPNVSVWYRRLREPILSLSLLYCDQLWQLFSRGWTILLSTVIYDLDSRIAAKYSKCQSSFYSMQVSFRFHSWDALRCLYLRVSAQRFEPGGFIEPGRFRIFFPYVDTSPISQWPSRSIWDEIPTTILQNWSRFVTNPSPRCSNTKTQVSDNSVMYDTTKLISIGLGALCWLPSRLHVPCSSASHPSGGALLN